MKPPPTLLVPLAREQRRHIYGALSTEDLFAAVDRLLDRYAAGMAGIRSVQAEFHDLSAEIEDRCREARTVLIAANAGLLSRSAGQDARRW